VARVRFSHRLHAAKGVACASCHRFNAAPLPPMKRCIACHRRRRATTRCTACHLSDKDGRLVVRFGTARLKPRGSFVRAAHTPLFERGGHKTAARANRRYCQRCHRSSDCLRCHAGSYKPMRIHRSDYVTHHALDARLGRPRCSSCHRSQSFCLSCHVRSGVSQSSGRGGFKPSTGLSFHPPGFNAARKGPGHHGLAARRNITGCVSCHAESTCIRCHGTAQRGMGGFSPHPVGFGRSLKCRVLARRNGRVCRKCHTVTPQCR